MINTEICYSTNQSNLGQMQSSKGQIKYRAMVINCFSPFGHLYAQKNEPIDIINPLKQDFIFQCEDFLFYLVLHLFNLTMFELKNWEL